MKRLLVLFALAFTVLPASASGASRHSVELSTGDLDGHAILGSRPAEVTAALGRPDFRTGSHLRLVVGWGSRPNFSMEVVFRPSNGTPRAWSIAFELGPVRDERIGDLLGRSPHSLQAEVLRRYAGEFTLVRPYACKASHCIGEFATRTGSLHLTFGARPKLGTWLTIWQTPAA